MIRYFISDLHLSNKRPDLIRAFIQMTDELIAKNAKAELYILGDFYEAWIGDDFHADWNTQIETALSKVTQSDISLFFLHGNRDFLIGKAWLERVGAKLITEQTTLSCDKHSILLTHGDEYCLEDIEYQTFRAMVRSAAWQDQILAMPLEQRIAMAAKLRNDSKSMSADKSSSIMDVTESSVQQSLKLHNSKTLVHGHTHRPATHKHKQSLRCVLGDWDKYIWLATIENDQYIQSKASVEDFFAKGINGMQEAHKETLQ
ncbi:UDP-2,3-diacylglucosamine diphosphatase [Marinomonas transparens]|uniref:UDP-2,3-diacylglucosamine hydrolase n=1 Tax=Marinomonas transparens TaxID=2795388 RepID=A0A934JNH7_9GAMM|nr:UDP-2,3-diacylglucosamine diphosphatase [Marinomonas transparens]MBJ7539490.1 UDP-2,3-diacylglucosamine diphosphatase [Marinomonas transparens]